MASLTITSIAHLENVFKGFWKNIFVYPRGVSDGLFRKSSIEYDDQEDKELYNKVCKQRELERKVRKSRTEADMLEAAGDTEGAKEVRRKMAEQNKQLKAYCEGNGLKYRSDRVRTYGSVKPKVASGAKSMHGNSIYFFAEKV